MANITIYPYGTGGSLPSSIGVINDLKTGGAEKALSAEMGKRLGTEIYSEAFALRRFFAIGSSGGYIYKEGSIAIADFPVTGGTKIVWKHGFSATGCYLAEYASDGTRKSTSQSATSENDKTITLNAATVKIRACFSTSYADAGIYTETGLSLFRPSDTDGLKKRVQLLESGAPYEMVEDIDVTYTDGYVVGFDGTATARTDGRISGFIPVSEGEVYLVGGIQDNATPAYLICCGYSSNDESTAIPKAFPIVGVAKSPLQFFITIPSGVNYIRLSSYNWDNGSIDALAKFTPFVGLKKYYLHDDALSNDVQSLKDTSGLKGEILFMNGEYCNNQTGTYSGLKCFKLSVTAVSQSYTNSLALIKCSAGDKFTIKSTATMDVGAFYDEDLTRLSNTGNGPYTGVLTAPTSTAWLLVNTFATDKGNYIGADRLAGLTFWKGTQAQYDAMSSHDSNTVYLIVE